MCENINIVKFIFPVTDHACVVLRWLVAVRNGGGVTTWALQEEARRSDFWKRLWRRWRIRTRSFSSSTGRVMSSHLLHSHDSLDDLRLHSCQNGVCAQFVLFSSWMPSLSMSLFAESGGPGLLSFSIMTSSRVGNSCSKFTISPGSPSKAQCLTPCLMCAQRGSERKPFLGGFVCAEEPKLKIQLSQLRCGSSGKVDLHVNSHGK